MEQPDSVLAFKALDNASLEEKERQMVLSACQDLEYDAMKSALRRIFGEGGSSSTSIKTEHAYFSSFKQRGRYQTGQHSSTPYQRTMYQRGKNPIGKDGKITRCSSCGSVNHYYRNCPDRDISKDNEFQANITEKVEEAQIVL